MGCTDSNPDIPQQPIQNPQHNTQPQTLPQVAQQQSVNTGAKETIKTPADMLALAKKNEWNVITDFAQESPIQDLSQCWLQQKELTYIPNFAVFKQLKVLSVRFNNISKIEVVNSMPQLEQLYLNKNQISKIQNLDKLINLTLLGLAANKIKKIEGLKTLKNLEDLTLFDNQIEVLEGLEGLNKITSLMIYGNKIKGTPQQRQIMVSIINRGGMVYLKNDMDEQRI